MAWIDTIKGEVLRRTPQLEGQEMLLEDLVDDAFMCIMNYSKANSFDKAWGKTLVRCVAMLYNNLGVEGSVSRSSSGISDSYNSTDILSSFIACNIPQFIRPSGYVYSSNRYGYPTE